MTKSRAQRRSLGAVAALVAALLVSSPAAAASWSGPVVYADPDEFSFGGQLVALSESKLVVVHAIDDPDGGWNWTLRRSTDGGRTWSGPIDTAEGNMAIAGEGDVVDRVRLSDHRAWYSRSTDAAASFGPAKRISSRGQRVIEVHVDRGADGLVAIVWHVYREGAYIRVSTDGGLSFGPAHQVAKASRAGLYFQISDVAVGDGAIFVAHTNRDYNTGAGDFTNLKVRRSTDGGQTWSRGKVISNTGDLASLDAEGTQAFIAYTEQEPYFDRDESSAVLSTVYYRATSNSGQTWTQRRLLPPANWDSEAAVLALEDGVLHALFTRCDFEFDSCENSRLFYRRSTDGISWSAPERVSAKSIGAYMEDIAAAGDRVFATYSGETSTGSRGVIHRRNP